MASKRPADRSFEKFAQELARLRTVMQRLSDEPPERAEDIPSARKRSRPKKPSRSGFGRRKRHAVRSVSELQLELLPRQDEETLERRRQPLCYTLSELEQACHDLLWVSRTFRMCAAEIAEFLSVEVSLVKDCLVHALTIIERAQRHQESEGVGEKGP
jgi:hypothetical protein